MFTEKNIRQDQKGFTLLELVFTCFMVATLMGSVIPSLSALKNPLNNDISSTLGFIKQVRARAISTTSAYRVKASGGNKLVAEYLTNCNTTTGTTDSTLSLNYSEGIQISNTTFSVCFNSRGFAEVINNLSIYNSAGSIKTIEVFLGGAARIQP